MTRRLALVAVLGLTLAACATPAEPVCRPLSPSEHVLFAAIVAHDEARVADLTSDPSASARLARLDPEIERQVFGARMGDPSVRTVLMQPPLCVVDVALDRSQQLGHVFPTARFGALQNPELEGLETGRPGVETASCLYRREGEAWRIADACLSTFRRTDLQAAVES